MSQSEEDSQEFDDIHIELPGLEETQIWQQTDEVRDLSLYLEVSNGKVKGPELAPFRLPDRWTFETLKICIKDYIGRQIGSTDVVLDNIYYKKSRSKTVVKMLGDPDVPALLSEYPLTYKSGRPKKSATLYMAVDYRIKSQLPVTPRRSPRIRADRAKSSFDIFVNDISADMKVSAHSNVLHSVPQQCTLAEITTLLKAYESDSTLYIPAKGLFWLRKGTKQPVTLRTEKDLQTCKEEYKGGNIRLACRVISLEKSTDESSSMMSSRKRKLDMGSSTGKADNSIWNEIHVQLVQDLEKRGTMWRYKTNHLKLWTDEIVNGNSSGIDEEPDWQSHIDAIIVPPTSKRSSTGKSPTSQAAGSDGQSTSTLEMIMALESKRNESFQTAMLTMLQAQTSMFQMQSPMRQPLQASPGGLLQANSPKALNQLTTRDCLDVIQSVGLSKYIQSFQEEGVDGPMLEAFIHPQLGNQMMISIGMAEKRDRIALVTEIYRIRARGYNHASVTSTLTSN